MMLVLRPLKSQVFRSKPRRFVDEILVLVSQVTLDPKDLDFIIFTSLRDVVHSDKGL